MTITLYGIPNCDTVKKARVWLTDHGLEHVFHDYKKLGIEPGKLAEWSSAAGWERLLNKAGTSFKKLSDAQKTDIDEAKAIQLMVENPSMIKRPVVEGANELLVGFKPDIYAAAFG